MVALNVGGSIPPPACYTVCMEAGVDVVGWGVGRERVCGRNPGRAPGAALGGDCGDGGMEGGRYGGKEAGCVGEGHGLEGG